MYALKVLYGGSGLRLYDFTLAEESQAPETNEFWSGPSETLITSPVCPEKVIVCCPDSMSQSPLNEQDKQIA